MTVSGPPNPDNLPEDGKLKTEVMIKDNRRYYLDLKENQRGRFLRVSMSLTVKCNRHSGASLRLVQSENRMKVRKHSM